MSSSSSSPKPESVLVARKEAWSQDEDALLTRCIEKHGLMKWSRIPHLAGLDRCSKSCKLRWLNYLDPQIKHETFDEDEEDLVIRLYKLLGNRWSLIAGRIPGRTANDIKNHWEFKLSKRFPNTVEREDNEN